MDNVSKTYGPDTPLTLSVMTLRTASFAERIQAAKAARFQGIGWRLEDFENTSNAEQLLTESKLKPDEVEFFRDWIGRENDQAYREREGKLLELAGRLGAKRLNVAVFEQKSKGEITYSFAELCKRAASFTVTVQLEFMPYTPPVNSLRQAWEIVREANQSNAGLLIDTWQWARAGESAASLGGIPPEKITGIQLSDDLAKPLTDVIEESRHDRLVPGEGAFNIIEFLRMLASHGYSAPISVEIMSDELDKMPPTEAAIKVAEATRTVLSKM
jgi:sugar phosphate isomerase/epimerase